VAAGRTGHRMEGRLPCRLHRGIGGGREPAPRGLQDRTVVRGLHLLDPIRAVRREEGRGEALGTEGGRAGCPSDGRPLQDLREQAGEEQRRAPHHLHDADTRPPPERRAELGDLGNTAGLQDRSP